MKKQETKMTDPKVCYFVLETRKNSAGEFQACIAIAGEKGYRPTDFFWGKDIDAAEKTADHHNALLGINKKEATKIVFSSMF